MNLRERAIKDSKKQNLKNWGLPIVLIDPDGNTYNTDAETDEQLMALQILYDYKRINPETGEEVTINEPIVTIALSSLSRIPQSGEKWIINMPADPSEVTQYETFIHSSTRAVEGGRSLGFIRLYPQKAKQS